MASVKKINNQHFEIQSVLSWFVYILISDSYSKSAQLHRYVMVSLSTKLGYTRLSHLCVPRRNSCRILLHMDARLL